MACRHLGLAFAGLLAVLPAPSFAQSVERPRWLTLVEEARAYEHGEGVPRDLERAIELYCHAARAGDAEAFYALGWIHANGRGVARDDALAAFFLRAAVERGMAVPEALLRRLGEPVRELPPCLAPPRQIVLPDEDDDLLPEDEAKRRLAELIRRLAPEYGIEPRLALAIAATESNFQPLAVSPKNAQGLMQLIPETAQRFNVQKVFDPEQNVRGGLSYLRWLLAYFRGDVALVAAAYNAGEGAVNRHLGIPPYAETRSYVTRILARFRREAHPYDPSVTEPSPELPKIVKRKANIRS